MRCRSWKCSRAICSDLLRLPVMAQSGYRVEDALASFMRPRPHAATHGMANAWLTLAEQHLKNSETVLPTPPVKASDD